MNDCNNDGQRSPGTSPTRRQLFTFAAALAMPLLCGDASEATLPPETNTKAAPLKDAFKGTFLIGTALDYPALQGKSPRLVETAQRHFSAFTPGNSLKPDFTQKTEGIFTFEEGDRLVKLAEQSGATPVGHTLVWHSQTPAWFFKGSDGKLPSRELALERMRKHIAAVVGHYKGKIKQWDVVNEAISDAGNEYLRPTPWLQSIGEDYLAEAFRAAHQADPKAVLIYNDYNIEMDYKRPKAVKLLKSLLDAKVPIHAVGIQGHWRLDSDFTVLDKAITEFAALGLTVMITEMDIGVLPTKYRGADVNTRETMTPEMQSALNPYTAGLPDAVAEQQAERYRQTFEIFLRHKKHIGRVTLWGVEDGDSWYNNFPIRGRTDYPMLFDRSGQPKPAFFAVQKTAQANK
jgi:endo-1,4-beta-xylanase